MAESVEQGPMFVPRRTHAITSIQQFQFGEYRVGGGTEAGVRLRFESATGGFNNRSSHTLTLGQLAGLVEIAAPDIPVDLCFRLISVLAGVKFEMPHPVVQKDADRWVD